MSPRKRTKIALKADDRHAVTHDRIVRAATRLFSQYGFRRTSMDSLAAAATVAKPTLYAYFEDKNAVFRAVCEDVLASVVVDARRASESAGTLETRVAAILATKFTRLYELVDSSPHALEILGSSDRVAATIVEKHDRAYLAVLESALDVATRRRAIDPARAGLTVPSLAALLLRCGHGATYGATGVASHRRQVAELSRVVLAAVTR